MPPRGYPQVTKTQHAKIRSKIDRHFLDAVRILEDSYYGTCLTFDSEGQCLTRAETGWRRGLSSEFVMGGKTWNKGSTLIESKVLFDRIHGAIFHMHGIVIFLENEFQGKPFGDMHLKTRMERDPRNPGTQTEREIDKKVETTMQIREDEILEINTRALCPAYLRPALDALINI